MKKKKNKEWQMSVRLFLLTACMLCQTIVFADDSWTMIYQSPNGETMEIPMSQVGCLVAVDNASDFAVLDVNGNVLAEGVLKVSFEQRETTIVNLIPSSNNVISKYVNNQLTIIGAHEDIYVYDANGRQLIKQSATGGETVIQIGHLSQGIYIVKTGEQTFKFNKK